MNQNAKRLVRGVGGCTASVAIVAILVGQSVFGQTIQNPSFEANSFNVSPGYISDNAAITGWTGSPDNSAGLNPAGGENVLADNGVVPNGTNVAFLQNVGTTLSTPITGLTVGTTYNVTFRANAGTNQAAPPTLRISIDSTDILTANIYPVSGSNPYLYVAFDFTATATSQTLTLTSDSGGDALLVDDFAITAGGAWKVEAWTGDADSGVDPSYVYTHAYSLGGGTDALINNVLFTAVPGVNPSVVDKFSTLLFGNSTTDAPNLTGASANLGTSFIYSGASVTAGTYQTITMKGLTPGTEYVATIYSVAWEGPSPTTRWATISIGNARLTVNQDQFDNNNGIRFSCRYTADASGTAEIKIAPLNSANVSIHCYGFSNREAISRNVKPAISVQPRSTTVSSGIPVKFSVAASGFPAPTYKWRFNGADLAGGNTDTYAIPQAASQNVGNYDVVVANLMGSVTSVVAKLVVGIPMTNPSFEADTFLFWPGYCIGNAEGDNGPITGWNLDDQAGTGLNPIADGRSPFADNGIVPNGTNVAFLQGDRTLSQTVSGLTVGNQYYLHYYENGRSGGTSIPALETKLGTEIVVPTHLVQIVGGANSYHEIFSDVFTASAASVDLAFTKSNPQGGDSTVLIDNVAFVPVAAGTAPFVSRNPQAQVAAVGSSVSFSGQAIGSLPMTFQWLKDGTAISQATSPVLTIGNVQKTDEADYALAVSNGSGSVTSSIVHLTVIQLIPGVFGTGVSTNGTLLAAGEVDPHYILAESADPESPGPEAIVINDGWPIQAGVWVLNGPNSKWIAPKAGQGGTGEGSAEGNYTYQTTFNLTGYDLSRVRIVGGWAVDNTGTDIVLNGLSTGITSPGFGSLSPFTITNGLVAGVNTLDFKMNNLPATPNPTGLRVDLMGILDPVQGTRPTLQATLTGTSLSVSWSPVAAGQKLQMASEANGSWQDIPNATNPFTTNTSAARLFFRVAQ